ncbi:putative zinc finger CCHC domain-containing protein 12-like [Triplophysa rosa]|uniref:Zinc finger CCHC domain-containing protein 12-like n=1 Tax=Triplophysa rosa TaxID=992332 RepID=A0A9W7TXA3_TRIRA|nr:putative zinc finger CCHC domain-containing protein 12-like [Triplophysa rosa]
MDVIERENFDVWNAVIVSGLTSTELDQVLETYLSRFGSIRHFLSIDDPHSEFHRSVVVEFTHDSAMHSLGPQLPLTIVNPADPETMFRVRAPGSVFPHTSVSDTAECLVKSRETQRSPGLRVESESPAKANVGAVSPRSSNDVDASSVETISVKFPMLAVHPPGIQREVMEHIVRTNDTILPAQALFDTWRASVDYLLNDPSLPESHKMRKILDSLLPPASDIIKHVNPNAPASECLKLLESVYGSVEDGDELLAKFISTLQNPGEKSSAYLHRLHIVLSSTIRWGGVVEGERDRCLLRQFCRGCWDNALIADLQLETLLIRTAEDKQTSKEERMRKHLGVNKPTTAPLKLRTASHQQSAYCTTLEEDAIDLPALDVPKQKAPKCKNKPQCSEPLEVDALKKEIAALQNQIVALRTAADREVRERAETSELQKLRGHIAELRAQVTATGAQRNQAGKPSRQRDNQSNPDIRMSGQDGNWSQQAEVRTSQPRPWYCFRCGEDGHLTINCENPPNPSRVEDKRRKLRERQAEWDLQGATAATHLNQRQSLSQGRQGL